MASENTIITHVTEADFDEKVLGSSLPAMFAIGAQWCQDCRRAEPFYKAFAEQYAGRMAFFHADSDESPALKERLGVVHIPTMIVFVKGKRVGEPLVEVKLPSEIKALIEEGLAAAK